jgi:hypothetical protein
MATPDKRKLLSALEANWQAEMKAATPTSLSQKLKRMRTGETPFAALRWLSGIMQTCGRDGSRHWGGRKRVS